VDKFPARRFEWSAKPVTTSENGQIPFSNNQIEILDAVFQYVGREGFWPEFGELDRPFARREIDVRVELQSLAPMYVHCSNSNTYVQPDETLRLTVKGTNAVPGGAFIVSEFLKLLQRLVSIEINHESTREQRAPIVTNLDIVDFVSQGGFRPFEMANNIATNLGLLLLEEQGIWNSFGGKPSRDQNWTITLSNQIRQFRGVTTIEAYLERLPGIQRQSTLVYPQYEETQPRISDEEALVEVDPRTVFIVHGRDLEAKSAVTHFLRDLDLHPVEWDEMVQATGQSMPYTGYVISLAFKSVHAVVVLLTPDDLACLHEDLLRTDDKDWERHPTGQARPNVLFETGMALATHPDRTLIIEFGSMRPFSDVDGRNTVRFTPVAATLNALAMRLQTAGCPVNTSGTSWLELSRFENLSSLMRQPPLTFVTAETVADLPIGRVLPNTPASAEPRLTAKLVPRGKDHLLEITNRGGVELSSVEFAADPEAINWHFMTNVLPAYPIPSIDLRSHVRLPLVITMGGPVMTKISLRAKTPDGIEYSTSATLSIFD
jgi:predicted nucleotide-binding protein